MKNRENLLEQIQRSAAWRAVKPLWKLFHRSRKSRLDAKEIADDLAFALDLPKEWKTNREILLIKGWCFSRSGKAIARIVPIKAGAQSWQRDSAPLDIKGLALSREVLKDRANSA